MAEAGVVRAKLPVVRIVRASIRTLTRSGPLRPLLGRVRSLVERIFFTESAGNLATSRPDTRRLPHLRSPFHASRPQAAGSKVQQQMPLVPQQSYPSDFGLTKLVEVVRPIQVVHHHVNTILLAQPVVERCFPPRQSLFPMLAKPHLRCFSRKSDVAITKLRPEPDPIDQALDRMSGHHVPCRQRRAITACS